MPDEHKSHNIVELENGQIGAYPNNRYYGWSFAHKPWPENTDQSLRAILM